MKKIILLLLFAVLGQQQLQAQQTVALATDNSTSGNSRAPIGTRLCCRSVYIITQSEMLASGFVAGDVLSEIGFTYTVAQNIPTTSTTFGLYMQNSSDATYLKTTDWDTSIAGMTQVRNTNITIPAATGIFTIPFSGSNTFTYTGGSIYVAFDYQNTGTKATTGNIVSCNTLLTGGIKTYQSNITVGTTLSISNFRPETYFTKSCVSTITPTFTAVSPITSGSNLSALPTTSNNNITGTWSPALNNTATTTYTFTPAAGQCAITTTMTITVTQPASSLHFSQTNNMVALGQTLGNFGTGDFAVEMKVKTQLSGYLLAKRSFCDADNFLSISISPEGKIFVETYNFAIANNYIFGTTTVTDNSWHQIAVTRTSGYLKLYVDGVLDTTSATNPIVDLNNNYTIHLGGAPCDNFNGNASNYFNGNMDEVRFWNRSLTQGEIQNNMNCEVQSTGNGLLANYHFNQGNVNANNSGVATLTDSSGNNNTGTLVNFDLTGTTSNWSNAAAVTSGVACAPYFVQYTTIPDANFEQALFDLGIDTINGDHQVLTSAISGITSLDVSTKNITNLTGIKDFTSLTELFCYGNQLTTLDVRNMTALSTLYCSNNQLTSLNVGGDVSLTTLGCHVNQLTTLQLSGLTSLTTLYSQNNQLSNLNFSGLSALHYVACNANLLSELDFSVIPQLTELHCDENHLLTSLNLSGLSNAAFVACHNNISLTCITTSDPNTAAFNSNWVKDAMANYSTNCGVTSKVKANQCGTTLTSLDQNINADYVAGYEQYRFEVTNGATVNTVDVNKYNFCLTKTPGITYGTTYGVRVAVKLGGTWGAYGASCNVTTPTLASNTVLTTNVHPNFCGVTLAALDTKIPAKPVFNAQGYRFEITTGGVTTVFDSASYIFKLSQAGVVVEYGMTYTIRVAALVNGVYGDYGASCSVATPVLATSSVPTTQVHPNFCGATLAALDTKIPASPVSGATGYRFEIITGGVTTVYDSATYNFKLSQSGVVVTNGTTYAIRVAAKINGFFGNYGASCNITTPGGIAKQIANTTEFAVAAYPNPFNSAFKLQVNASTDETIFVSVYDMMGKQVEHREVTASEIENATIGQDYAAGIYNVLVSQGVNTKTVRLVKN